MIEVRDLVKSFGEVHALAGVSFTVADGEVFGLLGPNGAGKTTTISILSGLLAADSGTVRVGGMDVRSEGKRVRATMGVVPQDIALYEELTGRENLHFWGGLYGLRGAALREAADAALDTVELADRGDDAVREYSGGMKRRLNLAVGLIHDPRVILLDEPTLGIDPQARISVLDIIKRRVSRGMTVVYTTHYLDEAEKLCDRIAIIDHGRILAAGTLAELTALAGEESIVTITGEFTAERARALVGNLKISHVEDRMARISVARSGDIGELLGTFFAGGVRVGDVSIKAPSLESVFIKLTGRELRD
jgi:ABC-2 type transport system ATP-binding protein